MRARVRAHAAAKPGDWLFSHRDGMATAMATATAAWWAAALADARDRGATVTLLVPRRPADALAADGLVAALGADVGPALAAHGLGLRVARSYWADLVVSIGPAAPARARLSAAERAALLARVDAWLARADAAVGGGLVAHAHAWQPGRVAATRADWTHTILPLL